MIHSNTFSSFHPGTNGCEKEAPGFLEQEKIAKFRQERRWDGCCFTGEKEKGGKESATCSKANSREQKNSVHSHDLL